ncbi:MAG TPA: alpha/beta hydrolase [Ignavibacteriaceae bacterium]|jgi:3-oxoadipate enol-lactonase|nr:alpha/beta hydrolase [Ignavibacteriaceae bacterium]
MNIKKNGISIFVEGDEGKTPVLFVHGFPFDHRMWNNQVSKLSSNYFCVTYDIRGLGDSDPGDGQYTIESFVDDLEMVVKEMVISSPVLCGFSMGGYISLRAAERLQSKLSGLILCDTKSGADNNEGKINRALGIKKINTEGAKRYVEDFIPNCFCEYSLENKKELVKDLILRSGYFSAAGIKGCLLAMAGRTDTTESLSKLEVPALVLCGEEDNLTPPDVMMGMSDKIHNSEFYIIPKAGHLSPLENPDAVNKHIENFLRKVNKK